MENRAKHSVPNNTVHYIAEEQELNYWSNKFGISKDELAAAVKAGLSSTAAVEKYVKTVKLTA